jgi:hypothetical protein
MIASQNVLSLPAAPYLLWSTQHHAWSVVTFVDDVLLFVVFSLLSQATPAAGADQPTKTSKFPDEFGKVWPHNELVHPT